MTILTPDDYACGVPRHRRGGGGDEIEPVEEPIPFDVEHIRADFPILERTVDGWPLVYLDSANTSQKPRCVVEAIEDHYLNHNANVARAMHLLGAEATEAYEGARATLAPFVGCGALGGDRLHQERLRGAQPLRSRAGRLAAAGRRDRGLGDGAPLQSRALAAAGGADRRRAALVRRHRRGPARPGSPRRRAGLVNERTRIVSVAYVSNVLGTVNPVAADRRRWATRSARPWCWTPRRRCLSCPWTLRRSVPTWWRSPATRWSARPGSGCSGAATTCSPSCRRSWAAGR